MELGDIITIHSKTLTVLRTVELSMVQCPLKFAYVLSRCSVFMYCNVKLYLHPVLIVFCKIISCAGILVNRDVVW